MIAIEERHGSGFGQNMFGAMREWERGQFLAESAHNRIVAIRPSARIAQRSGKPSIVAARKGRHALISCGVGCFGGARTAPHW